MSAETFLELDRAMASALAHLVPRDSPATVLYSGGVDSSLMAGALAPIARVRLLSIGVEGSSDLSAGRRGAELLGLPWTGASVTPAEVRAVVARDGLAKVSEPGRSIFAALSLGIAATPAEAPVFVGQGADELFGGYAHFRGLSETEAEGRRREDWDRLTAHDWPATLAMAHRLHRRLVAPFLDDRFSTVALSTPLPRTAEGDLTKPVLRAWALHRGIPSEIANRPKRAIQYGSGIAALVRQVLRD
jgi:asparagine synthase (glutamine-hydrolysing)